MDNESFKVMNLEKAILVLNIDLNDNLVKKLIRYIKYRAHEPMKVRSGVDKKIRNVRGHTLNGDTISDKIYFKYITGILFQFLPNYNVMFSHNRARNCNQVDLLKYTPGGKYEIHIDHDLDAPRTISCIINLNDNYEGGDFVFYDPIDSKKEIKRVKCKKGTIIYFPSNYLFPHSVEPITKGTRYSVVSWIV